MLRVENREELFKFIEKTHNDIKRQSLESQYFIVRYKGNVKDKEVEVTEPIYFFKYNEYWFESPCYLQKLGSGSDKDIREYVEAMYEEDSIQEAYEYESKMVVNGVHYEIMSLQVSKDYLTYPLEIEPISERDCIKWMIENDSEKVEYI